MELEAVISEKWKTSFKPNVVVELAISRWNNFK